MCKHTFSFFFFLKKERVSEETGLSSKQEREEGQTNTFSFFFQSKEKRKPVQTFLSKRKVY